LRQVNTGPLDSRAVSKIFRRIIGESRQVEMQVPQRAGESDASVSNVRMFARG
jgi:chorismate mutase